MLKKIPVNHFYHLINHGPCILITSGNKSKTNIAPIAWITPVNDEPALAAIALSETHYTTELINKTCEFVINIPDTKLLSSVKTAGSVSGRKTDKFKKTGLTPAKGIKSAVPHIKECIGFIECSVIDKINYDGVTLFIGKVLYCAAEKKLFDTIWNEKAQTIHHLGGKNFALMGKRV